MGDGSQNSGAFRIGALDGLRGWAALAVVIFHFTIEMWSQRYPVFRSFLPSLIGNGQLAVAIFFALSGYVLTIRRWGRTDNPPLYLVLLRRYLRLTIPILAAAILFYIVMIIGLTPTRDAARVIDSKEWLGRIANFDPGILDMLGFAFARVYSFSLKHNYGPFLWTMVIELWFSLLVLTLSQFWQLKRSPYVVLLLVTVVFLYYFPQAACFTMGAMMAKLQVDGLILRKEPGKLESAIATLAVIAAFIIASFFHLPTEQVSIRSAGKLLPVSVCGIVLVYAALRSRPVTAFLLTPFSQALGHLSFPVFLMHGIIAATVASLLVVMRSSVGPIDEFMALLIATASTLSSYAAAPLLVPVETFTLGFVRRIGRRRPIT